MKNKLFIILILGISLMNIAFSGNLPTIAVPSLTYTEKAPTTNNSNHNPELSPTTNATLTQEVQHRLFAFSADTRGALVNSKQFKVIDMPILNTMWNGNTQTTLNYVKSLHNTKGENNFNESASQIESKIQSSTTKNITTSLNDIPDYILLGSVLSITNDEDIEPIKNTDKLTAQYSINISVDYKVIATKNSAVVASFNAYGHANDTKILNANDKVQRQNHNIPQLINQASKNLAQDVVSQLQQQFKVSSRSYQIESITNLKVYN